MCPDTNVKTQYLRIFLSDIRFLNDPLPDGELTGAILSLTDAMKEYYSLSGWAEYGRELENLEKILKEISGIANGKK